MLHTSILWAKVLIFQGANPTLGMGSLSKLCISSLPFDGDIYECLDSYEENRECILIQ